MIGWTPSEENISHIPYCDTCLSKLFDTLWFKSVVFIKLSAIRLKLNLLSLLKWTLDQFFTYITMCSVYSNLSIVFFLILSLVVGKWDFSLNSFYHWDTVRWLTLWSAFIYLEIFIFTICYWSTAFTLAYLWLIWQYMQHGEHCYLSFSEVNIATCYEKFLE